MPRAPSRLQLRVVLGALAATAATFLAGDVAMRRGLHQIDVAADEIAFNSAPSIQHLAAVRSAVRHAEFLVGAELSGRGGARSLAALDHARAQVRNAAHAYLALPLLPGEQNLWEAVKSSVTSFDGAITMALAQRDTGAMQRVAGPADEVVDVAGRTIDFHAETGRELTSRIQASRRTAARIGHVLDASCVAIAGVAALLVLRRGRCRIALTNGDADRREPRAPARASTSARAEIPLRGAQPKLAPGQRELEDERPGARNGGGAVPAEAYAVDAFERDLPWEGDLAEESALRLLFLGLTSGATGRLTLHEATVTYAITLTRGVVVHVCSDDPADHLGGVPEETPQVTPDLGGERASAGPIGEFVTQLAAMRGLAAAKTFQLVRGHAIAVLAKALQVAKGRGAWNPGAEPPASSFSIGSGAALLTEAARGFDGALVRERIRPYEHRSTTLVHRQSLALLELTAAEAHVASLLDGGHSVAEIVTAHPAAAEVLRRVALLLAETDLLAFGATRPHPQAAPPAREGAAPEDMGAAGAPTAGETAVHVRRPTPMPVAPLVALDEKRLCAFVDGLRRADHFVALGVTRDAPHERVHAAYVGHVRRLHPDASPGDSPGVRQLKKDALARIEAAWSVLSDPEERARYAADMPESGMSAALEAEHLFARATGLVAARQYPLAVEALDRAVALVPKEREYLVWRAWAEFLAARDPGVRYTASRAAIHAALRQDAEYGPAYLFLGRMAKRVGDVRAAERDLRRGLALFPDDPELQRELRYLRT